MTRAANKLGDIAAAAGIGRIHILSWRDLDDVEAGGSELHVSRIAKLWAEAGIDVTIRTSYAQGHPRRVMRDGYRVIRRAGRYLVFPRAVASEIIGRHGQRDALVEIWNGMPFFSPLWARGPKVVLLHHVHAEMWKMVLGEDAPWVASLGDVLERRIAPLAYRRARIVTLSQSSKDDIVEQMKLSPERIDVVTPGVDPMFRPGGRRSRSPLVVAVGRLVPVKRYELLIRAVSFARASCPDLRLTIVGEGYERAALETVVEELDARSWIAFAGRVTDAQLVRLYRRAWVAASASAREGWGMWITEAAACGTPAVATRIAGHLDAVLDGESGLLVGHSPEAIGEGMAQVINDDALRSKLAEGALKHSARFTWEATALGVLRALAAESRRPNTPLRPSG